MGLESSGNICEVNLGRRIFTSSRFFGRRFLALAWILGFSFSPGPCLERLLPITRELFYPLFSKKILTRNSDGNPDSPQAVVFLTSIIDVTVGS